MCGFPKQSHYIKGLPLIPRMELKKMRLSIGIFWVCLSGVSMGQDAKELRHVTTDLHYADFYIQLESEKIKYVDTLYYFWFKSQAIHNSQGYASGYLLNGSFTQYYASGQLSEQGIFEDGLKTGEWKSWYETGQLKSIRNYEAGVMEGNFFTYNEHGVVVESGAYKSGRFHGKIIENGIVTKYKRGKQKVRKEKEPKEKKNKKQSEETNPDQQDDSKKHDRKQKDETSEAEEHRRKFWRNDTIKNDAGNEAEHEDPFIKRIFKSDEKPKTKKEKESTKPEKKKVKTT